MTSSLATKVLFGVLGAGTVGGTAVVGYKILNGERETSKVKKTIAQLIKESNSKVLLTSQDSSEGTFWKRAWRAYREANKDRKASKDPWAISGFTGNYSSSSIQDQDAPSGFVGRCESLAREEVDGISDDRYIQVFNWCTRNYKVAASDFLDSDNKVLLTNSTGASDATWKAAWEVYRKEYKGTDRNPWSIPEWSTKKDLENQDAPAGFISKCGTEAKVLVSNKESLVYQNLSKYCTKDKVVVDPAPRQ